MSFLTKVKRRKWVSEDKIRRAREEREVWELKARRSRIYRKEKERIAKAKQTVSGRSSIRKPVGTAGRYISYWGKRMEAAEKKRKKKYPGIWGRYV